MYNYKKTVPTKMYNEDFLSNTTPSRSVELNKNDTRK